VEHELQLLPQPGQQHPRLPGLVMAIWCEDCGRWYYRDKEGNWPTVCPARENSSVATEDKGASEFCDSEAEL
jgi:hypothetical protein